MAPHPAANRVRINAYFLAGATTLDAVWLDYGQPVRLKEIQWAEDIDDAGRKKLEQLLRVALAHHRPLKGTPRGRLQGIREWIAVAEAYRAAREAKHE